MTENSRIKDATSPEGHHGFDFGIQEEKGLKGQTSSTKLSTGQPESSVFRNGRTGRNVADFFSSEVFQIVLHNPSTAHQLLKFSQARMCGENMEFLERADRYNALLDDLTKVIAEIHQNFTAVDAPKQVSLASAVIKQINADVRATTQNTLPALELMFADAQEHIENVLAADIYPRFVKHQMTMSAVRALSTDRGKYAGLGDCFCITDPNIADNPILFASDGFVKVTGYSRSDIIPRNCRFLQGNHTDQSAVRRLKSSIETNNESVELLLNYRKTGEPFWNLLYVTPLRDAEGKTMFFLGGQINCSTTIHSCSDILRLLSASEDSDAVDDPYISGKITNKPPPFALNGLFKSVRSKKYMESREAGMEQTLLTKIEKMDFREQIKVFYTAYSKYIVINYDRLLIQFFSPSIVEMLCLDPKETPELVGNNIFKVLTQHAPNMSRNFKTRVKYALQEGRAISVDIDLVTKSSVVHRKSEHFVTHWTPLKDAQAMTKTVVVTLALAL